MSSSICLSCISGYKLTQSVCVSIFSFGIHLVLNPAANSLFTNNYFAILSSIASTMNADINCISVTSIVYGSVTIDFIVSTSATQGSADAQTQQGNLQNLLNNSTVASIPITSFSLVLNGVSSSSSGGLTRFEIIIIATTIPLTVSTFYII